jgi:hypothetical protein
MTLLTLVIWVAIAGLGGFAAILGSLMTLGALLLWLAPYSPTKTPDSTSAVWLGRWKLLGVSLALAIGGFALLTVISHPGNALT